MKEERAILAGGCFWGMQDLIRHLDGVISTRVGYTGGDVPKATYRNHGTHAEAIEIIFDVASPKGGQPPLDPKSNEPNFQTDLTRRFEADADAKAQLATTVRLDSVKAEHFDTIFYPGGFDDEAITLRQIAQPCAT